MTTQYAEVDGARIAYDVAGEGPAILLVHAGVTARGMWDDVVPSLAEDHKVVRFDLRGFGETVEDLKGPWSAHSDVLGVMDAAGIGRGVLVGVSMGGGAVIDAALVAPDRVSAVVAINPGLSGFDSDDGEWALSRFKQMKPAWDAGDLDAVARLEIEIWLAGPHRTPDDMPGEMVRRMHDWLLISYEKEPWEREVRLDPAPAGRLAEIGVPVLAVYGELDLPGMEATVDHIASGTPQGSKVTMESTAHLGPWEDPEAFVAILREFLAGE